MIHQSCFAQMSPPTNITFNDSAPSPRLGAQPAKYQIANYNIHPPPSIFIEKPFDENLTIYAQLVDCHTMTVVSGGFQSGDSRFLRAGQKTLYFTGLKLSKMAPIKTELHLRTSKQMNSNFCLKFKVGEKIILSDQFKLVSSCSQLPADIRDLVRPKKPVKRDESDEEEATGSPPHMTPALPWKATWGDDIKSMRLELESAIEAGDAEKAGKAAQKLALLKKMQSAH
eukprot:TRINITY_DN3276_c0_g1_i1.p1 TRINITY_DN3276_c0_g1~~TRINITY_DN3276_c0_g1_i1.p1  ORF type:complete len:227 (+),score=69.43 TRINITY_DN3276_c0_g1_i1:518-1198(+)